MGLLGDHTVSNLVKVNLSPTGNLGGSVLKQNATTFGTNPNWYNMQTGEHPWNAGYDAALVRLPTPFATSGFPNSLVNVLAHSQMYAGETIDCYGYGASSLLNHGLFTVWTTGRQTLTQSVGNDGPNLGDSGGPCWDRNRPSLVSGIMVGGEGAGVGPSLANTTLADNYWLHQWLDSAMTGGREDIGWLSSCGSPDFLTSTAVSLGQDVRTKTYVIAAYNKTCSAPLLLRSRDSTTGNWTNWYALSTSGLPSGNPRFKSRVAVAARTAGSDTGTIALAVFGADGQLYVANFNQRYAVPGTFTWTNLGGGFQPGTHPAIVLNNDTTRTDVFGIGEDGRVWSRSRSSFDASWSGWSSIKFYAGAPDMTLGTSPAVAYHVFNGVPYYFLVATSNGGTDYPNPGGQAWYTRLQFTTTDTWSYWTPLSGAFNAPLAVTGWTGGLHVYGIGTDDMLWKMELDSSATWSGWTQVWAPATRLAQPEGPSVGSAYKGSFAQVQMVLRDANGAYLIKYPW
jgi:hypothetical protein